MSVDIHPTMGSRTEQSSSEHAGCAFWHGQQASTAQGEAVTPEIEQKQDDAPYLPVEIVTNTPGQDAIAQFLAPETAIMNHPYH